MMMFIGLIVALMSTPAWGLHQGHADLNADYPAVVRIQTADQGFCTATKIAARWLLTAAHCVVDNQSARLAERFQSGESLRFSTAPQGQVGQEKQRLTIEQTHLAPAYRQGLERWRAYRQQQLQQDRDLLIAAIPGASKAEALRQRLGLRHHFASRYPDLALIQLREERPAIPMQPIDFTPLPAGAEVTLVGFGCARPGAQKRASVWRGWGTTQVIRVDEINFYTKGGQQAPEFPSLCPGNSGGPVLYQGRVVGVNVVVFGLNARLGARSNMAVNLATQAPWIRALTRPN